MKADARRLAEAGVAWPDGVRLILLHGADAAASRDLASQLAKAHAAREQSETVEISGKAVAASPGHLSSEASAIAMFGGPRLILVPDLPDDAVDAVRGLLDGPRGDPVVAIVPATLRKGNPLLALAEASPAIWHVASYEPGPREGVMLVGEIAAAAGLRPSQAAARALFDQSGGDRGVIRQEIAKLALFLDAEPGGRTPFDLAELAAIGSGGTDAGYDQLVAAILLRDARTAASQIAALDAQGEAGIGALRAVQRALWRLIDLRAVVDGGASPRAAVEGTRPPVFWKDKELVADQLGRWTTPQLTAAARALLGAERAIKTPASLGEIAAAASMLDLARR